MTHVADAATRLRTVLGVETSTGLEEGLAPVIDRYRFELRAGVSR